MTPNCNNCTCCDMSSKKNNWNSSHVSPFKWIRSWDKCTFTSKCPAATVAPATQHMQSRLTRCHLSHLKRTYHVLHEHMVEERKTQRNEKVRSLIANESRNSVRKKNDDDDDTTLSHHIPKRRNLSRHTPRSFPTIYPSYTPPTVYPSFQETAEPIAPHWQSDYRLTALNTNSGACNVQWCMCGRRAFCGAGAVHAHVHTRERHMMDVNTYCVSRSCDVVRCNLVVARRRTPRYLTSKPVVSNMLLFRFCRKKTQSSNSLRNLTSTSPPTATSTTSAKR